MRQRNQTLRLQMLAWLVAPALAFGVSSCSQDENGNGVSGQASASFSAAGVNEGDTVSLEKSALKAETITQQLGDGLEVEYTLAPSARSQARATVALNSGAKFRVVIYSGSTAVGYGDYTTGSESSGPKIPLTQGQSYTWVAYSYNSATLPTYTLGATTLAGVDPSNDLLWASGSIASATSTSTFPVTFDHKFSRVTVVADATFNNYGVTPGTTTVTPGYTANMDIKSGAVTSTGSSATQTVSWASTGGTTATGNAQTVFTNGGAPTITFSSVTINGTSYPNKSVVLTTSLVAGKSYTLTARFKHYTIWAGCNVYWDGSKLTFDAQGVTTHANYQGVFFQWGSLVGISPARTSGSDAFDVSNTPIYVPTYNSGSGSSWASTSASAKGWAYTSIPYVSDNTGWGGATTNTYLIDAGRNTAAYWNAYKGDICQYIGSVGAGPTGYRLPHEDEFGAGGGYGSSPYLGWTKVGSYGANTAQQDGYANGQYSGISAGLSYGSAATIFPASGYRDVNTGQLYSTGNYAYYWSASYLNPFNSYLFSYYNGGYINVGDYSNRLLANPIRCVKN